MRVIEDNLVVLVLLTAAFGLAVPEVGIAMTQAVPWMLAGLMLCVSLTFDVQTLRAVLARPSVQVLATLLVYGPMSLAGWLIGLAGFGASSLGVGFALVGTLPTDVSSPLLVWLGRGNVALATVVNAVNTVLAPVVVPVLFLAYTGIELDVPVGGLVLQLSVTVITPTIAGVALRTAMPGRVQPIEPAQSAGASVAYLALLLAVIGPNAADVLAAPATALKVAVLALALNATGYALATLARPLTPTAGDHVAMLFTVSKKEFSIAAMVVVASGLPAQVALPAVIYAVVQMLTSPLVARVLARRVSAAEWDGRPD